MHGEWISTFPCPLSILSFEGCVISLIWLVQLNLLRGYVSCLFHPLDQRNPGNQIRWVPVRRLSSLTLGMQLELAMGRANISLKGFVSTVPILDGCD